MFSFMHLWIILRVCVCLVFLRLTSLAICLRSSPHFGLGRATPRLRACNQCSTKKLNVDHPNTWADARLNGMPVIVMFTSCRCTLLLCNQNFVFLLFWPCLSFVFPSSFLSLHICIFYSGLHTWTFFSMPLPCPEAVWSCCIWWKLRKPAGQAG